MNTIESYVRVRCAGILKHVRFHNGMNVKLIDCGITKMIFGGLKTMRKTVEKVRIFFDGDEARRFARDNHGWISDVVGNSEVTVYQVIYRVEKGRK